MNRRVAGAEIGAFADDGVGSMVDDYCSECRKGTRPRLGVKSFVSFAHVFCALQWGDVVDNDAGHVLPGVGDREVGIGYRGSRACDNEERISWLQHGEAERRHRLSQSLNDIQLSAVLRTLFVYVLPGQIGPATWPLFVTMNLAGRREPCDPHDRHTPWVRLS